MWWVEESSDELGIGGSDRMDSFKGADGLFAGECVSMIVSTTKFEFVSELEESN